MAIDQWIGPTLGPLRLEKLQPAIVKRWANQSAGRSRLVVAHCVLRSALDWAMTMRVLTYNPAALVTLQRPARKPIAPLSAEQGRDLLTAAADHRLGALVISALMLGLRIGEVSGLAWDDVDLDTRTLRIRQQLQPKGDKRGHLARVPLKTLNSRRTLTLPALVVAALQAYRTGQRAERPKAGATWTHVDNLVFTTPQGRPVHPSQVRGVYHELLTAAGISRVKFHTLRHTAATLLLGAGTPLFDVSRVLGHSQVSTTADIYGHLVPDMAAGAATAMDTVLARRGVK